MRLYGYYRSSTSYRIRIALALKDLEFSQDAIDLKNAEHKTAAFRALNPHQSLPVVDCDGRRLTQSLAILDWLEAAYPTPSLLPANADHIQLCLELYYAIATEIHAPNNLSVLNYLRKTFGATKQELERWNETWIHRTFEPVEQRLAASDVSTNGLPFGAPGLFEIVLIPQIYNARRWHVDLTPFPTLVEIDAHCATLDAFVRAHPDNQPDAPETNE